jgi:hypothetical protein
MPSGSTLVATNHGGSDGRSIDFDQSTAVRDPREPLRASFFGAPYQLVTTSRGAALTQILIVASISIQILLTDRTASGLSRVSSSSSVS